MNLARTLALCTLACAGCAHLPDGKINYYLAKTQVRLKVTRTIACDSADHLVSFSSVTQDVSHSADLERTYHIPYAKLRSVFADTDMKVDFTADGRLQAVNATLTGHGEEVLKAVTSILSTVAIPKATMRLAATSPNACAFITKNTSASNKTLTLSYEGDVDPAGPLGTEQALKGDALTQVYAPGLPEVGGACAVVVEVRKPPAPFSHATAPEGVLMTMRQPALVRISARTGSAPNTCSDEVWSGTVPVAHMGTKYKLPLQKAPVFGTQKASIAIAESGAVTSLQYATTSGTAQALNVVSDALTKIQDHASKQADAINAEVNLIIAQQRLAKCRADPAHCQ